MSICFFISKYNQVNKKMTSFFLFNWQHSISKHTVQHTFCYKHIFVRETEVGKNVSARLKTVAEGFIAQSTA